MLPRVTEKRGQKNYENHNTRKSTVRNSRNGFISKIGTMEISIDMLMGRGDVPPIDNSYRQPMTTTGRRFNLSEYEFSIWSSNTKGSSLKPYAYK